MWGGGVGCVWGGITREETLAFPTCFTLFLTRFHPAAHFSSSFFSSSVPNKSNGRRANPAAGGCCFSIQHEVAHRAQLQGCGPLARDAPRMGARGLRSGSYHGDMVARCWPIHGYRGCSLGHILRRWPHLRSRAARGLRLAMPRAACRAGAGLDATSRVARVPELTVDHRQQ